MNTSPNFFANTSERLLEMLSTDPQWPTEKKGLCTKICNSLNDASYPTVHKWLYKNSLPRTPEERQYISEKLGVDLIYWEYGVYTGSTDKPIHLEPIHYLKHSNAVLEELNKQGLRVGKNFSEELLLKIQQISITNSEKNNRAEPDIKLINDTIELVVFANKK